MKAGRKDASFHPDVQMFNQDYGDLPSVNISKLILNLEVFHFNECEIINKTKIFVIFKNSL